MALWVGWGLLLLAILRWWRYQENGGHFCLSSPGQWEQGQRGESSDSGRGREAGLARHGGSLGRGTPGRAEMGGLTTGRVERAALGGGHPEVGRASVKDDFEGLGWGADVNLAIVLGLWG